MFIQIIWAPLIISKTSALLKKLNLPAFSYPPTFLTFHQIKVSACTSSCDGAKGVYIGPPALIGGTHPFPPPSRHVVVGRLSNLSWVGRKLKYLNDTDSNPVTVANI